jgi:predicted nucleic acid-binding Zn ribbon protein
MGEQGPARGELGTASGASPTGAGSPVDHGEFAPRRGLDVAKEALAAARSAARARAQAPGAAAGGASGAASGRRRRRTREARSGARPDDRDPQPLGRAIDRLLADRGWEVDAAVGRVLGRWDSIVGPEVAAHCRPESFTDSVLTVTTDSTAWATQVRLLAPALVRRLNEELGSATVSRVRVLGPAVPSWVRGRLSVRGRGPRDTYG